MKKTHISIAILLAIALLYGMWFVGFSQGQKAGELKGQKTISDAIFKEIGETGSLRVPIKDDSGNNAIIVLQIIRDEKGQVILYKPQ